MGGIIHDNATDFRVQAAFCGTEKQPAHCRAKMGRMMAGCIVKPT
ncbi:hypothetical protein HMPREF9098_0068 [Kingella denitrificans ATCC 33394]|uniref:Uncharacterized protein n=1 Tax=Kingella denitrificans ATCC 33394 TaxID=888741 RepID=F0EW34_9NEIS|nr:hypothetical protein HMPREF9098_0068 [Kingella denitrificans ATCC 33394]